jgi:hypothetical protein
MILPRWLNGHRTVQTLPYCENPSWCPKQELIGDDKPGRKCGLMSVQLINRLSRKALVVLSLIALLTVLSGYTQPPQPDEGAAAHIFQLSIVALIPTILLFLATADGKQPLRSARPLAFPAAALLVAFIALYYLEHYR